MKKWTCLLLCAALTLVLLWSCTAPSGEEGRGAVLWFSGDTSQWTDATTAVATAPYRGELTVPALMEGLLSGPPEGSELLSSIPRGTRMQEWSVDDAGLLRLDLSEEYAALSGLELTLADYCITMTMEQLPEVKAVTITVNGRQPDRRTRQWFTGEQVILTGAEEQPVEMVAALYFPRSGGRGLGIEHHTFLVTEDDVLVEIVTRALLEGPSTAGLTSLIPRDTGLISARLEDGVCRVDFTHQLVEQMPEDEDGQILVLYSIADTLGNLDQVDSVVLLVEGEELTRYGAVDFGGVLEPDFGLAGSHSDD